MKYLLYAALPLALMACKDNKPVEKEVVVTQEEVVTPTPAATDIRPVSINETMDAARNAGGFTRLPIVVARQNIRGWINKLELEDKREGLDRFDNIIDNLEDLYEELELDGDIDGHEVGEIMLDLGRELKAKFGSNMALTNLADQLEEEGAKLDLH